VPASDAQLVSQALRGDRAAFGELARRYRGATRRLAERLTGDPETARDLTQEALLRAYLRLGELREPGKFGAWLLAIARSVCVNWLTAQAIRRGLEAGRLPALEAPLPAPAEQLERRATADEVRRLVSDLPEAYRAPLERHYFGGQPQPEIARELGVPLGTVKARVHHARQQLREKVSRMSRTWYGECECPGEREFTMPLDELAKETLKRYDLGSFEAVGSIYEPHDSIGIGVQTSTGRHRLWRYHCFMTPEVVELEHAMLAHLAEKGVPVKRLLSARDGTTWQEIDGQLVAVFEWFSGPLPDITNRRDLAQVAGLHARWTLAMQDFDPDIPNWRQLAASWRARKGWAWILPTEQLPLVRKRMGFLAAVRDLENPPVHHERMLDQVRDTEQRLERFAAMAREYGLADLPRGMNHGVFLLGCIDWEAMVTDGNDFQYEARVGDFGRLLFGLQDREMPPYQVRDSMALALDTYCERVNPSAKEVRALPVYVWSQFVYYDLFHILLYLCEQSSPDRGEYLVAKSMRPYVRIRDEWEQRTEELVEFISNR
jgi:RNA polymerase sigma-70 factor (ECF subfamily)